MVYVLWISEILFEMLSYLEFYQFSSFNEKHTLIRSDKCVVTVDINIYYIAKNMRVEGLPLQV
jgi:hypothetical protein